MPVQVLCSFLAGQFNTVTSPYPNLRTQEAHSQLPGLVVLWFGCSVVWIGV